MKESTKDTIATTFILGVLISLFLGIIVAISAGGAYFEAQAYKRVTGKDVSVWDAMFLDLRVQEEVKRDE